MGFRLDVSVHSANLWSDFSEKFLSYANTALFEECCLPREHHATDVKCRLDLQRELQLIPGRPHLNTVKLHCFTQKSDGMRLGTAFRATTRGMAAGTQEWDLTRGRFSLSSCALLSPPSGGSDPVTGTSVLPSNAPQEFRRWG